MASARTVQSANDRRSSAFPPILDARCVAAIGTPLQVNVARGPSAFLWRVETARRFAVEPTLVLKIQSDATIRAPRPADDLCAVTTARSEV